MKKNNVAILLAAGKGERMNGIYKQFILMHGKPLYRYALNALVNSSLINTIIVVVPKEKISFVKKDLLRKYKDPRIHIIEGGTTRRWSAYNALSYISLNKIPADYVLFHDAVRPMLTTKIVETILSKIGRNDGIVLAAQARDLILQTNKKGYITGSRKYDAYSGYTPQSFLYSMLWKAHKKFINDSSDNEDDNIELLLRYKKPKIAILQMHNIMLKLTFNEDLPVISALLKNIDKHI